MVRISIKTKDKREVVDITHQVNQEISKSNFKVGLCNLFVTHTTASLATADLNPGTDQDYLDAFEKIVPKLTYKHPHDPFHMPDHIHSTLIGTSINIPVASGKLLLGIWQKVVLIEFDVPKERQLVISLK